MDDDDGDEAEQTDDHRGARTFYLSLAKLTEEIPHWGGNNTNDDSSDEDQDQRSQARRDQRTERSESTLDDPQDLSHRSQHNRTHSSSPTGTDMDTS